jgi:hypothetical protein
MNVIYRHTYKPVSNHIIPKATRFFVSFARKTSSINAKAERSRHAKTLPHQQVNLHVPADKARGVQNLTLLAYLQTHSWHQNLYETDP